MEIVVGTYDEVILGFRLVKVASDFQIEASFTDNSHSGCVKCVSVSEKGILASGSTDETIRLLNLRKKKEMGSLVHHNGSVTSLQFHKNFLFSTSEDSKLCLWKTFTWECLRTFKGHKSGINSVSVHPSGKLALTVGRDRALHTWNLITGRSAFISNIKQVADIVRWSLDGEKYVIVTNNKIDIYSVETAEIVTSKQTESRINCAEFYNRDILCYGGEGGSVFFYNIAEDKQVCTCNTDTTRIKGLAISTLHGEDCQSVLCIASSDGHIKIYGLNEIKDGLETELLAEHNTRFRVTCMAVYSPKPPTASEKTSMKRKKDKVTLDNENDIDEAVPEDAGQPNRVTFEAEGDTGDESGDNTSDHKSDNGDADSKTEESDLDEDKERVVKPAASRKRKTENDSTVVKKKQKFGKTVKKQNNNKKDESIALKKKQKTKTVDVKGGTDTGSMNTSDKLGKINSGSRKEKKWKKKKQMKNV